MTEEKVEKLLTEIHATLKDVRDYAIFIHSEIQTLTDAFNREPAQQEQEQRTERARCVECKRTFIREVGSGRGRCEDC